ncbi:MAG: MATE family efflux transporter, partial [Arcanobacterium sp.]|nr:MATE family efflux transporter [Arcanobacterium sp.]
GKILQLRKNNNSEFPTSLLPTGAGLLRSLKDAFPLFLRTVSLRGALLLQIFAATSLGTIALASNQIIMALWNFAAYGLDALATAAQILVGQGLGRKNKTVVRMVLNRCLRWGFWFGVLTGISFLLISTFVPHLMSTDDDVRSLSQQILWICGILLPIAAITYMLDGVLIGAGDSQKLAKYMLYSFFSFLPLALGITYFAPSLGFFGMHFLWISYGLVFMGVRAGTMLWRIRGEEWMIQKNT